MSSFFDSNLATALETLNTQPIEGEESKAKKFDSQIQSTKKNTVEISDYLKCPHKVGLWKLTADWNQTGAFATFLFESMKNGTVSEKAIMREEKFLQFNESVLGKVSPLFCLLKIALGKDTKAQTLLAANSLYRRYFKYVDISDFKKKFGNAVQTFQDNVDFEGFEGVIKPKKISKLGDSYLCSLSAIKDSGKLELVSSDKKILEVVQKIISDLGQADNFKFEKVFSPEEDLFEPYFEIMVASLDWITNDKKLTKHILTAYGYFNDEDYLHCVTSLGRAAEDYLSQVYETFLREPIPRNLTIGQIYDGLHHKIRDLTNPPKRELKVLDTTFEKIKDSSSDEDTKSILREILSIWKADRDFYNDKFTELGKKEIKKSVFPKIIQENMDDLLRNRNAASHKTRIPIGRFEALKTLYCLYSLVIWWENEKQVIDWDEDKKTVIEKALLRSLS